MNKKIPYGSHEIDVQDIDAVVKVLREGPITQGAVVEQFGNALAEYSGSRYGSAVSSGTAALHLAVTAMDLKPGDEVITTPITFCATANVVLYQGGEVKFVDIDENTLNINPELIEEKITEKTKGIIPVDFRGHPAALSEIKKIADKYELFVIEDGSHSIGSKYGNNLEYTCGDCHDADICTFSFHPVKHITTGEGGAVLTNNPELYRKMFLLRKHGIDRREDMFDKEKRIGKWIYDMEYLGYNYRLTDFQAALGLNQLTKIEKNKIRRREIFNYYNENFKKFNELILPFETENVDSNFHLYIIQIKENKYFDRYDFFNYLQDMDYYPMVHYIPIPYLSYYKKRYGFKKGDFPIAESYYNRAISLPLYPSLKDSEVDKVVRDISKFIYKSRS